jgi:hypothetical protein
MSLIQTSKILEFNALFNTKQINNFKLKTQQRLN